MILQWYERKLSLLRWLGNEPPRWLWHRQADRTGGLWGFAEAAWADRKEAGARPNSLRWAGSSRSLSLQLHWHDESWGAERYSDVVLFSKSFTGCLFSVQIVTGDMCLSFSLSGNLLVEQKTLLSLGQQAVSLRDSHDRLKALRRVTSTAQILLAYSMVMRALSQTASRYVCPEYSLLTFFHHCMVIAVLVFCFPLQRVSVQPVEWARVAGSGRHSYFGTINDSSSRRQGSYLCGQTARCKGDGDRAQQLDLLKLPLYSHWQRGVSQPCCLQTAGGNMHPGQCSFVRQLMKNAEYAEYEAWQMIRKVDYNNSITLLVLC